MPESRMVGQFPPIEVSPRQFEAIIADLLHTKGTKLGDLRVKQGERLSGSDGEYVVDATVRFSALGGAELLVLVEAKLQQRPVEREAVQKLQQIMQSTGAHKGIIVASSGFQRGALEFAEVHRIALVQLVDGQMSYETRSRGPVRQRIAPLPQFAAYEIAATAAGHRLTLLTGQPEYVRALLE